MAPAPPGIDRLREHWGICCDVYPYKTICHSGKQLDWIATHPRGAVQLLNYFCTDLTLASDHVPIIAELEIS